MALTILVEPHPLLEVGAFVMRLPQPLASVPTPAAVTELTRPGAVAPIAPSEAVKAAVRDLLRQGGYKPSGRSKPASEYLVGAVLEGRFPTINAAVDACNVVSLHSGLPISLVDIDRVAGGAGGAPLELTVRVAPAGTSYVFNPSGQVIDASGLLCLYDPAGPTGTPVKDAQRTKTHDGTRAALALVWGTRALGERTRDTTAWYRRLVGTIEGVLVEDVALA